MKRLSLICCAPLLFALIGCEASKSSTPLSPSVAGPIPGVDITAPKPLEPLVGSKVAVDRQPVTLLIENASSSGPRPLTLSVEMATDASFAGKVFVQTNIPPGENGRTALRLPDPLAPGHNYYWRVKAEDGANSGPYSPPASFEVFTPIVLDEPILVSPINNEQATTRRPRFTFINPPRSGPLGTITYTLEFSTSFAFESARPYGPIPEQPNQTTFEAPEDAPYNLYLFWRVRATDGSNAGPWSVTQAFRTMDSPSVPSPAPSPTPGGSGHIPAGGSTEDRAKQVVLGTGKEFPELTRIFGSEGEAVGAADQLLRRTLWHLQLAGFQAAGQKNPSGAISSDKITVMINNVWRVFDIYSLGIAGRGTTVQWIEITGANPFPRPVIPD